jgi:Na+-driven multidrug efflux pump
MSNSRITKEGSVQHSSDEALSRVPFLAATEAGVSDDDFSQDLSNETTFWQAMKENWREGLPIVLSTAAQQISMFWGMKLLSECGKDYNSAEQSINAVYYLTFFASTMPFLAVNQFIASKFHDDEKKGEIINDLIASSANIVIISTSTALALGSSRSVLTKMGHPDAVIEISGQYFDFYRYAVLPTIASGAVSQALTGLEDTVPIGVVNTLSAIACVIAQYAFVKGTMGQSQGCSVGLSKSATIQMTASATLLLGYLIGKMYRHPEWRSKPSVQKILKSFLGQTGFGLLIDLIVSAETGALFLLTGLIAKHIGKKGLGDFNIITQFFSIGVPLQIAIRQATTAIMSRTKSKRDNMAKRIVRSSHVVINEALDTLNVRCANRAIYAGVLNCSAVSVLQFIASVSATKLVVQAFDDQATSEDIIHMRQIFVIYNLVNALDAIRNMYAAGLAANKNIVVPFLLSIFMILGATVGFSELDLALGGELFDVFGINGGAIAVAVGALGYYWHKKESNVYRLTYKDPAQAAEGKDSKTDEQSSPSRQRSSSDSQFNKSHNFMPAGGSSTDESPKRPSSQLAVRITHG